MTGMANTPVASYLFKVNQTEPILLGPSKKEIFRHITMQLAYLAQWGCPNIHTVIMFLQTQVTKPDEDDYKKLGCVIKTCKL